jgi:hypothetical protein
MFLSVSSDVYIAGLLRLWIDGKMSGLVGGGGVGSGIRAMTFTYLPYADDISSEVRPLSILRFILFLVYDGVSKSFWTESITIYTLTTINTR